MKSNRPLIFGWILVILALSPILWSGLYSDDLTNFLVQKSDRDQSLGHVWHYIQINLTHGQLTGRFTPGTYFFMCFYYWLSASVLGYKILLFSLSLFAVFCFTRLLISLGFRSWVPVALLLYCGMVQFYINFHDPFTSLHGMYPTIFILIIGSVLCFNDFLTSRRLAPLIASIFLTMLCLFYSESGVIVYMLIFVLLLMDNTRNLLSKALLCLPYIVVLLFYLVVYMYVRSHSVMQYSGVSVNFKTADFLNTLHIQLYATRPLAGFFDMLHRKKIIWDQLSIFWPLVAVIIVMFCFLMRYLVWGNLQTTIQPRKRITALAIGFILFIVPALPIALSSKYQQELHFGIGYLPVYIQNFGLAIIFLVIIEFLLSWLSAYKAIAGSLLSVLFLSFFILSFLRNTYWVSELNRDTFIPATYMYKSLKNDILNECPANSVIVIGSDYMWRDHYPYDQLFDNLFDKHFKVVMSDQFHGVNATDGRDYYLLMHDKNTQQTTLYKLGPNEDKQLIKKVDYPAEEVSNYFKLIYTSLR
ncbi:MAG: hypothetical protein JWO03_3147 [Bacteroidetes bacterium]|nr:hypothetical protein [Bacteroidota bacterium]